MSESNKNQHNYEKRLEEIRWDREEIRRDREERERQLGSSYLENSKEYVKERIGAVCCSEGTAIIKNGEVECYCSGKATRRACYEELSKEVIIGITGVSSERDLAELAYRVESIEADGFQIRAIP